MTTEQLIEAWAAFDEIMDETSHEVARQLGLEL